MLLQSLYHTRRETSAIWLIHNKLHAQDGQSGQRTSRLGSADTQL